ncbi:MAG TPA: hypothetical protein PLV25_05155, partial [Opitutales bacterium]|nr:hypothetical protein [Opitutales bacterium]
MKAPLPLVHRLSMVALFVLSCLGVDRGLSFMCKSIVDHSHNRFSGLYQGGMPQQILVLGNSRGVMLVYPPDFKKVVSAPVFNLSYNGLNIQIMEAFLDDYLDFNEAPLGILIELSGLNAKDNAVLHELKPFATYSERLQLLFKKHCPTSLRAMRLFNLYSYNCESFLRSLYFFDRSKNDQTDWCVRDSINPEFLKNYTLDPRACETLRPVCEENLAALGRILATCKARNIPVALIVAPYLPHYIERLQEPFEQWLRQVQAYVGDSYPIHDYSGAIFDISCFQDNLHMNVAGSRKLLEQLLANGTIA